MSSLITFLIFFFFYKWSNFFSLCCSTISITWKKKRMRTINDEPACWSVSPLFLLFLGADITIKALRPTLASFLSAVNQKEKKEKYLQTIVHDHMFAIFFLFLIPPKGKIENVLRAEARLVFRLMAQPTADIKDVPSRKRKTKRTFSFHFFKKWKISVGSSVDCFLLRENYVQSTGSYPRRLFLS